MTYGVLTMTFRKLQPQALVTSGTQNFSSRYLIDYYCTAAAAAAAASSESLKICWNAGQAVSLSFVD